MLATKYLALENQLYQNTVYQNFHVSFFKCDEPTSTNTSGMFLN